MAKKRKQDDPLATLLETASKAKLMHDIAQALSRKKTGADYRQKLLDNALPYIESGNAGLDDDLSAIANATWRYNSSKQSIL